MRLIYRFLSQIAFNICYFIYNSFKMKSDISEAMKNHRGRIKSNEIAHQSNLASKIIARFKKWKPQGTLRIGQGMEPWKSWDNAWKNANMVYENIVKKHGGTKNA